MVTRPRLPRHFVEAARPSKIHGAFVRGGVPGVPEKCKVAAMRIERYKGDDEADPPEISDDVVNATFDFLVQCSQIRPPRSAEEHYDTLETLASFYRPLYQRPKTLKRVVEATAQDLLDVSPVILAEACSLHRQVSEDRYDFPTPEILRTRCRQIRDTLVSGVKIAKVISDYTEAERAEAALYGKAKATGAKTGAGWITKAALLAAGRAASGADAAGRLRPRKDNGPDEPERV